MNARRDSSDGPEFGPLGGRALLIGAVVFAAAATGLLILTDQEKWLRLGIVAALWAALTGALLATWYRRQLADQRDAAADRQAIYELELEREIAARREYELEVAAQAKRQAEETSRDDIAALRGELQNMRQTLESLLGGEFLVERYALQSTRMRSLGEDRPLAARRDVKHLPAAVPGEMVVRDPQTEMLDRIRDPHQKPPPRPEPRVADSRPPSAPRRPDRPARPDRPTPEPVKQAPPAAAQQRPHPAEMSDRWFMSDGIAETPPAPRRSEQPRRQEPQRPTDPPPQRRPVPSSWDDGEREWAPSWQTRQEDPGRRPEPAQAHGPAAPRDGESEQNWLARYNEPEPTYGSRAYVPQSRAEPGSRSAMRPAPPTAPVPAPPTAPVPAAAMSEASVGGHRRAEPEDEPGSGRRRRADGQPSWQETVGRTGEESGGSHASGRSVSELLADNGRDTSPRRRRRRED
jgi:hypothetical protein